MKNRIEKGTSRTKAGDLKMLKSLRQHGQLTEVDHLFLDDAKARQEVILVVCSDTPHLADKVLHQIELSHSVSLHSHDGGGCRLGMANPIDYSALLNDLAKHVVHTVDALHKQAVIVLMGEYPCQWAQEGKFSPAEQVILLKTACQRMQEVIEQKLTEMKKVELVQQVKVYPFFYISWNQHKKRTYQLIQ